MKKVVFIDSGIGGISTLREFAKNSYDCEITYIADNLNVPYGGLAVEKIMSNVEGLFNRFVDFEPDITCLACNTMSTTIKNALQKKYQFRIVGVCPNVDDPIKDGKRNILLLGTKRTIEENYEEYRKKKIIMRPQSDLAKIIERYIFDEEIIVEKIEQIKNDSDQQNIDAVVLGCTHYSLVKNIFQSVFSKYIAFYDNNLNVVSEMARYLNLNEVEKIGQNNSYSLRLTDNSDTEVEKYLKLLKNNV
ncbi:MAG: aspartate/glutamate racemase family protein [Clostridia bacterium]